jgi:sporulation protein YlmC with PRC-barrel domain
MHDVIPMISATTVIGDSVVNEAGEDLGKIEEIMLDVASGQVGYAVLSFGGFMGMGDRYFAVPWQTLNLDEENHRFFLNVPKARLEDAPGFDKDHWPNFADPRFTESIEQHYRM